METLNWEKSRGGGVSLLSSGQRNYKNVLGISELGMIEGLAVPFLIGVRGLFMLACLIERTIKEFKNLPCSLWLTGRVHEEECDGRFSVNRLKAKNCVCFLMEKRMERKR